MQAGGGIAVWRQFVAVLGLLAAVVVAVPAPPAAAAPNGMVFASIAPSSGNNLLVARIAANNPQDPPTWQLKATISLTYSGHTREVVSKVRISYPGSSITTRQYAPLTFPAGDPDGALYEIRPPGGTLPIHDGLLRDLPFPLPSQATISVYFRGRDTPVTRTFGLAVRENSTPLNAYFFPAQAADLQPGLLWAFHTRHVVDSGGGTGGNINPSAGGQRYGYDLEVVRWDDGDNEWTPLRETAEAELVDRENDDYLGYGTPLYSMFDGTITQCSRGEPDHAVVPSFSALSPHERNSANYVYIRTGDETVKITHLQDDAALAAVCPNPGSGLSTPVQAGQRVGTMGNTGNSTNPHLHIHMTGDGQDGVPINLVNIRTAAHESSISLLGEGPILRPQNGSGLHRHSLILPNPCGFDLPAAGQLEVAHHGITEDCHLDRTRLDVARGYHPTFVDGFRVGSTALVNSVFRSTSVGAWRQDFALTQSQFEGVLAARRLAGYRLHQVDSYTTGAGALRFAAIFEQRAGPAWDEVHGRSDTQFQVDFDDHVDDGFTPVNVSGTNVGGSVLWTALFERLPTVTGIMTETVPASSFASTVATNEAAGRQLTYVNGVQVGAIPSLTGIFLAPVGGDTDSDQNLSGPGYQTEENGQRADGRLTRAVTGYAVSGTAQYAGVFRTRPNTGITAGPSAPTSSRTATFRFGGDPPFLIGLQCFLDRGVYVSCSSPKTYSNLSAGSHTFRVRAVDREGLLDPTPATRTWSILGR